MWGGGWGRWSTEGGAARGMGIDTEALLAKFFQVRQTQESLLQGVYVKFCLSRAPLFSFFQASFQPSQGSQVRAAEAAITRVPVLQGPAYVSDP